jgi:hypothetical protein
VQRLGSMRHCPRFKYNSVQFLRVHARFRCRLDEFAMLGL